MEYDVKCKWTINVEGPKKFNGIHHMDRVFTKGDPEGFGFSDMMSKASIDTHSKDDVKIHVEGTCTGVFVQV